MKKSKIIGIMVALISLLVITGCYIFDEEPEAIAKTEKTIVLVGTEIELDGSESRLIYSKENPNCEWELTDWPIGSSLVTSSISDRDKEIARVTTDVVGEYTFRLTVELDGKSDYVSLSIIAKDIPEIPIGLTVTVPSSEEVALQIVWGLVWKCSLMA